MAEPRDQGPVCKPPAGRKIGILISSTMLLIFIVGFAWAHATEKSCETIPESKTAITAFRETGDTSGFAWVWYDWTRCRSGLAISPSEYADMAEKEYVSGKNKLLNESDDPNAAEARFNSLREMHPEKRELDDMRERLLGDVRRRHDAKVKAINSLPRCATKDFSAKLPQNWDQKKSNWCYAHAAAAAASFELGVEVSVPDVVANYLTPEVMMKAQRAGNDSKASFMKDAFLMDLTARTRRVSETGDLFDPILSGGLQTVALEEAAKVGFCRASQWQNQPANSATNVDRFELMQTLQKRFRQISSDEEWSPYRKVFPRLTFSDYRRVAAQSRADTLVRNLGRAACTPRLKLPLKVKLEKPEGPLNVAEVIQSQLLMNHVVPIGDFFHAFIIAGQRLNKDGICVFKVRDTSGKGCAGYESFEGAIKGSCSKGYFEVTAISRDPTSPLALTVTTYTKETESPARAEPTVRTSR